MMAKLFKQRAVGLACTGMLWSLAALAVAAEPQETVVVIGSATAQRAIDAPFAVTVVDAGALRDAGPQINLSEALVRVPGVVVNNRNNYAQDLQMSSRGFGARAAFGVRGLRIYTDGIPATMPDGQGQVAHADLAGAERIEVLRGPFSVLYGNSSGGVIAVFTAPVRSAQLEAGLDAGSFGLRQARLSVAAPLGQGLDLRASLGQLETDGFRPHSAADRQLANVRLGWQRGANTVVLLLSDLNLSAQDPLGLTPAQFAADPRQTSSVAEQFNTRKTVRQTQEGLNWRHRFGGDGALRESALSVYNGSRGVTQWQAIPVGAQTPASQGGGVVDFDRSYRGVDAKLSWRLGEGDLVTGLNWETQRDDRLGFNNFTGTGPSQRLGVTGALRRDETNTATTREAYAQVRWPLSARAAVTGGVRSGKLSVNADDHFLSNGDDSGALGYRFTNPVLGLHVTVQPGWALHASAARGFESPTLGELAYSPAGVTGFNSALRGQTSRQFELGSKWRRAGLAVDATVFAARTDHEIGVLTNSGGRATFQNVGRTRRHGAELGASWQLDPALRLQAVASWLSATYVDAYLTCTASPCTTPTVAVAAGNRIAGTSRASAWAEAAWRSGVLPGELALEWRAMAAQAANDTNTTFAPGYALLNLRWSGTLPLGPQDAIALLARVDNATDRAHVGSVIVNDGNGRHFEPGPPRSLLLSARWQHRW